MKTGLHVKTILTIAVLIFCMAFFLSFFFIKDQKSIIFAGLKQRGLALANNIAYNSDEGVLKGDIPALKKLIQSALEQPDIRYCLIEDDRGEVLAGKGWKEKYYVSEEFRYISEVARKTNTSLIQLVKLASGQQYYDIAVPIHIQEASNAEELIRKKIGVVRLGISLSGALSQIEQAKQSAILITMIIAILACIVTFFMTIFTLAPIQELVKAIKKIAQGDLTTRVHADREDELGDLARAVNQMTENLKHSVVSIELLKKEQKRFRDVSEATGDWIWEIDSDGRFVYSNRVIELVLGYGPDEVTGKMFYDFCHPEEKKDFRQKVLDIMKHKGIFFEFHSRHVRKTGEEVILETNGVPILDDDKEIIGYRGVNRDITRRKMAEEAIRRSEKMLSLHVQRTPLAYVEWNRNSQVVDWNPSAEQIFGYTKEEATGKTAFDLIVPAHAKDNVQNVFSHLFQKTGGIHSTLENIRKDGQPRICEWYNTPLENTDGEIIGLASLIQDITESKRVEEELRHEKAMAVKLSEEAMAAIKAKSIFLANMSHEIRTPMNAILGFSEILQRTNLDERQQKYLNTIESSGQLLIGIINDILDFSKLEAGKISFESINFNLEYLIYDVFRMVVLRLKERPFDTYIDIDHNVPRIVRGDPTRMRQVFINLLGNALKFTSKGSIGVIVRLDEQQICGHDEVALRFTVKDTGIGISEEKKDLIFESFTQADESMTRRYGGTGLGLAICRAIIQAMGGKIWVESKVNKGSSFIFDLKMIKGTPIGETEIYPLSRTNLKGKKVFIIDDCTITNRVLSKCCERIEMDVIAVEDSPYAALYRLEELSKEGVYPDIIICDIMMSGINGYEFVKRVRAKDDFMQTKVLAISSDVRVGESQDAQKKGFDGFISKPVVAEELLKVIETILGDKRQEGEIVTRHMAEEYMCKGVKILVVEDSKANRELIKAFFYGLGCEGDFAENGQEAIDLLKKNKDKYSLCFMDVQMPIMGGLEATKEIREKITKDLPIIALTAAALKDDEEKCLEVGMNDYITKPINMIKLRDKIIEYTKAKSK